MCMCVNGSETRTPDGQQRLSGLSLPNQEINSEGGVAKDGGPLDEWEDELIDSDDQMSLWTECDLA